MAVTTKPPQHSQTLSQLLCQILLCNGVYESIDHYTIEVLFKPTTAESVANIWPVKGVRALRG